MYSSSLVLRVEKMVERIFDRALAVVSMLMNSSCRSCANFLGPPQRVMNSAPISWSFGRGLDSNSFLRMLV